ncbi:MAG: histidine triad nucleotide-binding protein [Chloroflexota bacterium]
MKDCIFCRIVAKQIPSQVVYEDSEILAFRDIHPMAPVHVLFVPKAHVFSVQDLGPKRAGLVVRMVLAAKKIAKAEGLAERGYRLSINTGPEGGQLVPHLHMHLLGGRRLDDKLG